MVYVECVLYNSTTSSEVPLAMASETEEEEGIKKDRFAASFACCLLLVRYNIVQYVHVHVCHTLEYDLASVS